MDVRSGSPTSTSVNGVYKSPERHTPQTRVTEIKSVSLWRTRVPSSIPEAQAPFDLLTVLRSRSARLIFQEQKPAWRMDILCVTRPAYTFRTFFAGRPSKVVLADPYFKHPEENDSPGYVARGHSLLERILFNAKVAPWMHCRQTEGTNGACRDFHTIATPRVLASGKVIQELVDQMRSVMYNTGNTTV